MPLWKLRAHRRTRRLASSAWSVLRNVCVLGPPPTLLAVRALYPVPFGALRPSKGLARPSVLAGGWRLAVGVQRSTARGVGGLGWMR